MLMTLPIFVSPVWVLDVCLDTAFNCGNNFQFGRTSTTYYDLGVCMVCGDCWKFICCCMHVNFNVNFS